MAVNFDFRDPSVITVGTPEPSLKPCAFEYLMPTENCTDPGIFGDVTIFALRLIYKNALVKFRRSNWFGSDGFTLNGSSLWGVREGYFDATPPNFALNYQRSRLKYAALRSANRPVFVFKSTSTVPALNPAELFLDPIGLWFCLICCFGFWGVLKQIWKFHISKLQILPQIKCHWMEAVVNNFYRNLRMNLAFWNGFFLSAIGSYVVVVFLDAKPQTPPIHDFKSFKKQVISGEYRPVIGGVPLYQKYYSDSHPELKASEAYNPPIIMKRFWEAGSLIERETAYTSLKHVAVGEPVVKDMLMANYCDLEFAEDETGIELSQVMFHSNNITMNFDAGRIALLDVEHKILIRKYLPRKVCRSVKQFQLPNILGFRQLYGLFLFFAGFQAMALVVFIVEALVGWLLVKI